jgi:ectoine hydroxylase-related dioxygenase (phytanoyl-CoA dioxygenase family)
VNGQGFFGPVRLFDAAEAGRILTACRDHPGCWLKGLATVSPEAARVARLPQIVDLLVRPAVGDDAVLWGAHLLSRAPGDVHPWHTDIETSDPEGRFVSVWIPLSGGSRGSGLRFVAGSHRSGVSIQQARAAAGLSRDEATDAVVLGLARRLTYVQGSDFVPPHIVELAAAPGEAVVFDGHTWHASRNDTPSVRTALILQYAAADYPVRKADLSRLEWPFRYHGPAPCLLVSGRAPEGINRIVEAPQ